jgi:hypothetical protein
MKQMRLGDLAKATVAETCIQGEIEGQIRDLVHRDSFFPRKPPPASLDPLGSDESRLLERISTASLEVIDGAISRLREMKAALLDQNEQARRELRALELAAEEASGSLKEVSTVLTNWKMLRQQARSSRLTCLSWPLRTSRRRPSAEEK